MQECLPFVWETFVFFKLCTGLDCKAVPRLQDCCMQVEAEEVSNCRNKIHQTTYKPFSECLYMLGYHLTLGSYKYHSEQILPFFMLYRCTYN